jgi:hypothetical protein
LETIGSQLETLSFRSCDDLDIMDLQPCVALENLYIAEGSAKVVVLPDADDFLPNLKTFEGGKCLGKVAKQLKGKANRANFLQHGIKRKRI